ncbi:MAG: Nif3-like dinuclear metal center hexameric protein [Clostridiales bacterium]|nr:Nif3-like dinuclear metal center hexameric protein [Clostridiales bacterium]
MITVKDVCDFIDSVAPFSCQLSFDNSGFLVGDPDRAVSAVSVSLDITKDTIKLAKEFGADLMVSHHPVIFGSKKTFTKGDAAYELAVSGMSAVCVHTPLDCADGGVNDVLADIFSLSRVEPVSLDDSSAPMIRVGFLKKPLSPCELAAETSRLLDCKPRWCDGGRQIETVAVCGGSGGGFAADISNLGVDAFITGDAGYHDFLEAEQSGLTLVAAGHFETEFPVIPVLAAKLRERFPEAAVITLDQRKTIKYL